jgi:FeS assembly SUF system protein
MDVEEKKMLESRVLDAIKTVYDPEIPVNIYDLGLIYETKISDEGFVHVRMTLTAPNCPVAESLPVEVRDRIKMVSGVANATVEVVLDPPWSMDLMTDAAKLDLGML